MPRKTKNDNKDVFCSFCGRFKDEVGNMFSEMSSLDLDLSNQTGITIDIEKNDNEYILKGIIDLDDLLLELRKKSISSIEDVEYALLETNGELSIFPYNTFKIKENIPLPFIIEGIIQEDILKQINKSKIWVNSLLDSNNLDLNNIFYAIYQKNHVYVIKRTN